MESFFTSFLLIFIAEMGDKTQLMSMAFTAKFKASQIILAISAATVVNNLIAVAAGTLISGVFPVAVIQTVSYALFILFGLWIIRGDGSKDEEKKDGKLIINPFFTVAIFFFISEFGDKTQIAAMTLTMKYGAPVAVFAGASLGMICANLIGIGAGVLAVKKVPADVIKWISAAIFTLFGLIGFWTVFYSKFGLKYALISEALLAAAVAAIIVFLLKRGRVK